MDKCNLHLWTTSKAKGHIIQCILQAKPGDRNGTQTARWHFWHDRAENSEVQRNVVECVWRQPPFFWKACQSHDEAIEHVAAGKRRGAVPNIHPYGSA